MPVNIVGLEKTVADAWVFGANLAKGATTVVVAGAFIHRPVVFFRKALCLANPELNIPVPFGELTWGTVDFSPGEPGATYK